VLAGGGATGRLTPACLIGTAQRGRPSSTVVDSAALAPSRIQRPLACGARGPRSVLRIAVGPAAVIVVVPWAWQGWRSACWCHRRRHQRWSVITTLGGHAGGPRPCCFTTLGLDPRT